MLKRISLLIAANFAVLITLSVAINVLSALGVFGRANVMGAYGPLLLMSAVIGFGGAFISLLISKWMAKWSTGAQVIKSPRNPTEAWLLDTVRRHAEKAGLAMPEVALYESPEPNAFATGPTRNHALVAVSTGLLERLDRAEVEAVLGHEISHVQNGDMVTLTLLQGVLNTFVVFFSRIIGGAIDSALRGRDEERRGPGIGYWVATMVSEVLLGILAMLVVRWFSRRREYRADAGGAALAGRMPMISALRHLGSGEQSTLPKSLAAFGINGGGISALFSSHPPIEDRIRALSLAP